MGQGYSYPKEAAAYRYFKDGMSYKHRVKSTMFLFHIPYETKLWINKPAQGIVNLHATILASALSARESGSHFVCLLSWMARVNDSLCMALMKP